MESRADGTLRRVRLLETDFHYPLLRVEERLEPAKVGGEPAIRNQNAMVAGHLLVKAANGVDRESLEKALRPKGWTIMSQIPGSGVYLLRIPTPNGSALPEALNAIHQLRGMVAYAEPDFIVHATTSPNDPRFAEQWALNNTGQTGGSSDADIDAPEAWSLSSGSSSVVVAVLDSGVDYTHTDLASNIWTNTGETPGNGLDDDHDGYIDDVRGWNFVASNNAPLDDDSHGTHVAGIIGATGNNGAGVTGVAWQVKLMPLKFLSSYGYGATSDAVAGINFARVKGASIINHSWGGPNFSQTLKDAIDAAGTAGILNVCAAHNGNLTDEDITPNYPSGFASASVLAVASTTETDALSSFSDYGANSVHLGAPGSSILSTIPNSGFGTKSGTSMATPHVSGIAALLKAYKPSLTGADLRAILQSSVDVIPALTARTVTGGRANAFRALDRASDISVVVSSGVDFSGNKGGPFTPATKTYTLKNHGASSASWTAVLNSAYYATVSPSSGNLAAGASTTVTLTLSSSLVNAAAPGHYEGNLTVTNTTTGKSTAWPVRLDVGIPYIYSYDLSSDPGWPRQEMWQFGQPTGHGGGVYGSPDPTAGATGANVFGVNLKGNYAGPQGGPYSLTAGPFDLRGYTNTKVEFQRWLNTPAGFDAFHAVQISHDEGVTWSTLWSNDYYSGTYDSAWSPQTLPLSDSGDNQTAVYLRWIYAVTAPNPALTSSWNLDDIKITGQPGKRIFMDGPTSANENGGTATLLLHVEPASPVALTVSLASSDLTAATLPASVTVPANTSSLNVTATLLDNAIRDGTRLTLLTPTATGYTSIPWNFSVCDNETATLSLNIPSNGTEGNTLQGTVSMSSLADRDVFVKLTSSQSNAASVPTGVTIPIGQTSATFVLSLPQNRLLEGSKAPQITASVANWTSASANLTVADDESPALTLYFPKTSGGSHFSEGTVPTESASVSISAPRLDDTVVSFILNDTTEFTLPAAVTIPAGVLSASFSATSVIDDALQDGVQTVLVTASSPGLTSGTANVMVADNELAGLAFDLIPSPQTVGSTSVTVRALDVNGALAAGYIGTATIAALNNGVADPAFTSTSATFVNGIASDISVPLPTLSSRYALKATQGSATGTSNVFAVDYPPLQTVSISANELAYDAASNRLYASTNAGTIVPIHPDTGAMDTPIAVSTGSVGQIEISNSGSVLYALINGGAQIVKVDLTTKTVGTPFGFGTDSSGTTLTVADFAILPNDNATLGVVLHTTYASAAEDHVVIYTHGVKRPTAISYLYYLTNPVHATQITAGSQPNRFYASTGNNSNWANTLYLLDVTESGVQLARSYDELGSLFNLTASGSLITADSGRVFEAETGNPRGRMGTANVAASVCLDEPAGRICRVGYSNTNYVLEVDELNGFSEVGQAAASTFAPLITATYPSAPTRIIKCGARNVAYRTANSTLAIVRTFLFPLVATPEPDLAVQQIAAPATVVEGQPMTFNILIRNHGNAAASNVVLTSDWDGGDGGYRGASTTKGTFDHSGNRLTVAIGSLAANETATVCLELTGGSRRNAVQVTTATAESMQQNNFSTVSVSASPSSSNLSTLALNAADLAYSKTTQRVYASLGLGNGFFAGTVAVMDLSVPAVRAFIPVGSSPGALAMAENQTDLSIALDGSGNILPLNISTLTAGTAYAPGAAADGRRLFAKDMIARPGASGQLVLSRQDALEARSGVALFSGGSMVGSALPATEWPEWLVAGTDGGTCFGYGQDTYQGRKVYRLSVSESGVNIVSSRSDVYLGRRIGYANGRVIGANGLMLDAATLSSLGYLENSQASPYPTPYILACDPELERIFVQGEPYSTPFRAYSSVDFSKSGESSGDLSCATADRMIRWGSHGLAYCTTTYPPLVWINDSGLVPAPPLHVNLPAFVTENAGSASATVQVTIAPASNLTVSLTSSLPSLLQVPASVVILPGQTSASFNVTLTNDGLLNGSRNVSVTPSGVTGYDLLPGTVEVRDDEIGLLSLNLPASVTEGSGTASGQASVTLTNGPAAGDITVRLSSNRTDKLTVPATVTIPTGQSTATFDLTVLNDGYLDSTQMVTVTASVGGWAPANRNVNVQDDESPQIALTFYIGTVTESSGSFTAQIQLSGPVATDTPISLASSDTTKLTVPASVVIPANSDTLFFQVTVVDNVLKDGRKTVTITASAPSLTTGSNDVIVLDNDPAGLVWSAVPDGSAGDPIQVSFGLKTIDGDSVSANSSTVSVTAKRGSQPIPADVQSISNSGGEFVGVVRIFSVGTNTQLSVNLDGLSADSNAFSVTPGPLESFVWDPIAGNPQPNVAIPVTIRAADGYGNPLTSYNGTASLTASQSAGLITAVTGSSTFTAGMDTSTDQARLTSIVWANQIGRSGKLRSLSLDLRTPPGRSFDNFVIRAKHTANSSTPYTWDNSGYTVLRQGALNLTQSKGWVEIPFTTLIDYDGTSNLYFDIYFTNAGTASGGSYFGNNNFPAAVSGLYSSSAGYGTPDVWNGYFPYPNNMGGTPSIRLSFGNAFSVSPTSTGNFVNGVWMGNVTFNQAASNVALIATSGMISGQSTVFDVGATPPDAPVVTALETYSRSSSQTITWATIATATDYYVEAATDNTFGSPSATSGWITSTSYAFSGLAEGTHYYFHVKARKNNLEGSWSNVVDTTIDTLGPKIYLSAIDDSAVSTFITTHNPLTIHGRLTDTAGIANFYIILGGTYYALTVNPDGSWSVTLTIPSVGSYSVGFYAIDKVTPTANTSTRYIVLTRSADTDGNGLPDDWQTGSGLPLNGAKSTQSTDFDGDGRANLLEYAFNSPPNNSGGNAYPCAASEVKAADAKTYLVYRYDRRRGALDLNYALEFSSDLVTWSTTSLQTEAVGTPTLNPDGVTERVTTRILPDISQISGQKLFVRLSVTSSVP